MSKCSVPMLLPRLDVRPAFRLEIQSDGTLVRLPIGKAVVTSDAVVFLPEPLNPNLWDQITRFLAPEPIKLTEQQRAVLEAIPFDDVASQEQIFRMLYSQAICFARVKQITPQLKQLGLIKRASITARNGEKRSGFTRVR
jgi:hypothetical protein